MNLVLEKAELDIELQICMVEEGPFGKRISHPLVNDLFYVPEMNSHYNKMLAHKKEECAKALADGDFGAYIFWHERPWRAEKLYAIASQIPAKDYWPLVASVWMDSENIWQNKRLWKKLLTAKVPNRELLMKPKDKRIFKALCKEEVITLYRGHDGSKGDPKGFSWTTDYAKAEWFARRFKSDKYKIESKQVPTSKIIAYLDGRNEKEVIWIP